MSHCFVKTQDGEAMSHCFVKTQDGEAMSHCFAKTQDGEAMFHMVQTSIVPNQFILKRYLSIQLTKICLTS